MSRSVGKGDPAKMTLFYSTFAQALYRGGRRNDAILATEHVQQWIGQVHPTAYFLCSAYYNYADVCLLLWESADSKAEIKMFKSKYLLGCLFIL